MGAVDIPGERKLHTRITPRTGGIALLLAFAISLIILTLFPTKISSKFALNQRYISFFVGALICFSIGLIDDFHPLRPKVKLLFQIIAASVAFWGGVRFGHFNMFGIGIDFGPLSYFFTVFWFVLFINAINLIDGLDGLASGLVFFAAAVMVFLAVIQKNYLIAMLFSIVAGVTLGFLRYNFNPATVFLGDGGSYFLGYTVAGLSIIGSLKSEIGAITMIPLLSLGIPLFDTILSPLRRFVVGKKIFHPDADHVHHRFLKLGFSVRQAVLLIYTITLFLCSVAVILVNVRNERAGLFLIILGVGAIILFRKLGYMEQIYSIMLSDWVNNGSGDIGFFSRERRLFFGMLTDLMKSQNIEALWQNVSTIIEVLRFDKASLYLNLPLTGKKPKILIKAVSEQERTNRRKASPIESSVIMRKSPPELDWIRPPFTMENYICSRSIFRLELPLMGNNNTHFGTLVLVKDMKEEPLDDKTLKHVVDLKRAIVRKMETMDEKKISHE